MSNNHLLDDWRSNDQWRDSVIREAVRDLAKTGTLSAFEHVFVDLGKQTTVEEAIELFRWLQRSRRSEEEWKDEFLSLFPAVKESDLPEFQNLQSMPAPPEPQPELGPEFKYPGDVPY